MLEQQALDCALVRIFGLGGAIVGAGFLIQSQYVLTCAHVVNEALDLPAEGPDKPAVEATVNLDFPILLASPVERPQQLRSRVVVWSPVDQKKAFQDIAVLKILDSCPKTASAIVLKNHDPSSKVMVKGFPVGFDDGAISPCASVVGAIARGLIQLHDEAQAGILIQPGFSGAPVWDAHQQAAVGMLVISAPEQSVAQMIAVNCLQYVFLALVLYEFDALDNPPSTVIEQAYRYAIPVSWARIDLPHSFEELLLELSEIPPDGSVTALSRFSAYLLASCHNLNLENIQRFREWCDRTFSDFEICIKETKQFIEQQANRDLDYASSGQVKGISSMPTMWARLLTMEMVLHNQQANALRQQMVEQWQGMLAVIALAEMRGFPLTVQLIELSTQCHEGFARSLYELLPEPSKCLYTSDGRNPWEDIYVFLWNGNSVGMTSPSTLVCPSDEGIWTGLPWWRDNKLEAPHCYINAAEKALLWRWLEKLRREIGDRKHNGHRASVNIMGALLDDFRYSLLQSPPEQALSLSDDPQFFGEPLNRVVLSALNFPVKAQPRSSSVKLIGSRNKANAIDLLIIDPEISRAWNESPQNIWVNEGKTLASLKVEDLKTGKLIWKNVRWLESKDLFLPRFVYLDQEEALPGALMPNETQPLTFNGQRITPLIPLNPVLLEYFSGEDLVSRVQFQPINNSEGPQVRVIIDLPLAGTQDGKPPTNFRLQKDYLIEAENALSEVPVLEVWPNFRKAGWKEYYAFYYDGEYGDDTFQIHLPLASPIRELEGRGGLRQIARLEEFPEFITCQNSLHEQVGLILLRTPEEICASGSWHIGVDFGTSFTNVFVNSNGNSSPQPLKLENLLRQVTDTPADIRLNVLFDYFIPENFIPLESPWPLSSVLTTKGSVDLNKQQGLPILDGRIYVPNHGHMFNPGELFIKTDLKWSIPNIPFIQLFLKHLALHITALAAKAGMNQIQWSLSFPSAFSMQDRNRYNSLWQELTQALSARTNFQHRCPEVSDVEHFRTKSLAFAQYFADQEGHNLVNSTCIDIGGRTSDISIWENNSLIHQCSVQLAGCDLFSQFLAMNSSFQDRLLEGSSLGRGLKGGPFNAKLDVWLRLDGDDWLRNRRIFLEEDSTFQGLMTLTAIGVAGLYYYVGVLLRALHEEKDETGHPRYRRPEITPVYVGGDGLWFFNCLAEGGQFDRYSEINGLLSRMMSCGSGFEDTRELTSLSRNPRAEVACGLLLSDTKLRGLTSKMKDFLISGEQCKLNGLSISSISRLEFEEDIQDFQIPQLVELPKFLYEFHVALRDLEIEGVKPLPQFNPIQELSDNVELWRAVDRELRNILLQVKGDSENIRLEPPFILALKALLCVLGRKWANI
jgi:hypothetical protein